MINRATQFFNNHLALLLVCVMILRLTYLWVSGLDLIGDECYYWDWSRKPDWSYYSKPPMVAWLISIFTWLGGNDPLVVRLPAVLLGTVFLGFFYATAREFYNAKAAALASLLILATPFNAIANLVMTIDPPLFCFWIISVYFLRQAIFDNKTRAWLWAGIATGAGVLSKQVALLLPVMLALFLFLNADKRRFFQREYWLYLLPVVISLIPLVIWNQQHNWVMLNHSSGHFHNKESWTLLKRLSELATFGLYQLLLATPVLFFLLALITIKDCLRFFDLQQKEQFLILTGPVWLLAIFALSFLQKVQGNWPVPFYFSGFILLAGRWSQGYFQKWIRSGLVAGAVMITLTYSLPFAIQFFNLHNTAIDPTHRFRHWRELGRAINAERTKVITGAEQSFVLALGHRHLASRLAFYLPDHPNVFRYEKNAAVSSQYEVWPGPVAYIGGSAIIVSEQNQAEIAEEIKSAFKVFKEIATIPNPLNKNSLYHLFLGESLKFWPPHASKD